MAADNYDLSGRNQRAKVPHWMTAILLFALVLVVVGLGLAAAAFVKAKHPPHTPATSKTTTLPSTLTTTPIPPKLYDGTLVDKDTVWNEDYSNMFSTASMELAANITGTRLSSDVDYPSGANVTQAVEDYAKNNSLNWKPHITAETTATTMMSTTTKPLSTTTSVKPTSSSSTTTSSTTKPVLTTTTSPKTTPAIQTSTTAPIEDTTTQSPSTATTGLAEDTTTALTLNTETTPVPLPEAWYEASKYLKDSMNFTADPCDDFFNYVCGMWIQKHPTGSGKEHNDVFSEVQNRSLNYVREGIQNIKVSPIDPLKKLKFAFDVCEDSPNQESAGIVNQFMDSLGRFPLFDRSWDPTTDLAIVFGSVAKLHGVQTMVAPMVDADVGGNVSRNALFVNQGVLLFGAPSFYINESWSNQTEESLKKSVANITLILAEERSIDRSNFTEDFDTFVNKMYGIELALANITKEPSDLRNHSAQYNVYTIEEMNEKFPAPFNWVTYFVLLTPYYGKVVVAQPSYFDTLDYALANYTKKDLVNYLMVQVAWKYRTDLAGSITEQPRNCPSLMTSLLPWSTGRVYLEASNFTESARHEISDTVGHIIDALNNTMQTVDILDERSRANAMRKVDGIVRNPGYPDWIKDDDQLTDFYQFLHLEPTSHWLEIRKSLVHFNSDSQMRMLTQPVDRHNFIMSPAVVNAWYAPEYNSITFPAAILQPPFFRPMGPKSLNYGTIGSVIGHELTHGFDDEGTQYDWVGRLNQWMDAPSRKNFTHMAQCIVDEYSEFCPEKFDGKLCLNGKENQGENIADNGGIRQSLNAYRNYIAKHPEPPIPGFENYTGEQMFFIGFSQFWCGSETKKHEEQLILTNPHSPAPYRVLGTLSNTEEFAQAFSCPAGSIYNPDDKCYVWTNRPSVEE